MQVSDFPISHQGTANRYFKVVSKETGAEKGFYVGWATKQINEENIKSWLTGMKSLRMC